MTKGLIVSTNVILTSKLHESGAQVGWFGKPVCQKIGCKWVYHWAKTPRRREYNCCKIKISTRNSSCKNIIGIVAETIKQAAWVVGATTRIRAGIHNYWHIKKCIRYTVVADTQIAKNLVAETTMTASDMVAETTRTASDMVAETTRTA